MEDNKIEKELAYLEEQIEDHRKNGIKYACAIIILVAVGTGIAVIAKISGASSELVHLILKASGGLLVAGASILFVHIRNTFRLKDQYNEIIDNMNS